MVHVKILFHQLVIGVVNIHPVEVVANIEELQEVLNSTNLPSLTLHIKMLLVLLSKCGDHLIGLHGCSKLVILVTQN